VADTPHARRDRSAARLPAILGLAFGLRLAAVLWLSDTVPYSDYYYYHEAARQSAHDWRFFFEPASVEQFGKLGWWPPGYPMFVGAIYTVLGDSHRNAVFVQVLLGTLVCWQVYRLAKRAGTLWKETGGIPVEATPSDVAERFGLLAALLVAVNPTYIFTTNLIASENLHVLLFVFGLWLAGRTWRRTRDPAWTGVVLALGTLTRAAGLLLPVVVALWQRRRVPSPRAWRFPVLWLLGAYALTIAPWTLRNALVAGSPALVCFGGGFNFYLGHCDGTPGYRKLSDTPMGGLQTAAEIDRMGYRLGLDHIAHHPLELVTGSMRKMVDLFAPSRYALHANSAILDPSRQPPAQIVVGGQRPKDRLLAGPFTVLASVYTYLLLAGALAACLFGWRRLPGELRLAAYVCAYWIAAHVVFWAQPRFRYPMEVPLALLAAFILAGGLRRGGEST
jgi:hypothetical protein